MENPQLHGPRGEPVPMGGEFFVLSRGGISFSAKSGRSITGPNSRMPPLGGSC